MSNQGPSSNCLVVIGSGGMGLTVARRLASGRQLFLADNSAPRLADARVALRDEGHAVEVLEIDVSDRDSVMRFAMAASKDHRIDGIIHTAGLSPIMATARSIYEVDLLGTAHVIDAFFNVATPGTSLVCIASMAGHFASLSDDLERHLATSPLQELLRHSEIDLDAADPGMAYMVAKRGNQLRVQAAAHDWGSRGARLNTISPGVISTSMGLQELEGPMGTYMQSMIDFSGARRVGTPDDIASAAAFLVGSESSFITGNDLLVDGGTVAGQHWKASD